MIDASGRGVAWLTRFVNSHFVARENGPPVFRLQKKRWKALFVAILILHSLFSFIYASEFVEIVISNAVSSAMTVIAFRCFRGKTEPLLPEREWWRATAKPAAGFVLGGLLLVIAADTAIDRDWMLGASPWTLGTAAHAVVSEVTLGLFYLHSSFRLATRRPW